MPTTEEIETALGALALALLVAVLTSVIGGCFALQRVAEEPIPVYEPTDAELKLERLRSDAEMVGVELDEIERRLLPQDKEER